MKDTVEVDYSKLGIATGLPELVMEPMPDTYKAERMLSRAELLGRVPERVIPAGPADRLVLFSNVQFIYELVLARMEVNAFHIDSSLGMTMRSLRTPTDDGSRWFSETHRLLRYGWRFG